MSLIGGARKSYGARQGSGAVSPRICLRYTHGPKQADVAQQVEQLTRNEQVSGSSPLVGSVFSYEFVRDTASKLKRSVLSQLS